MDKTIVIDYQEYDSIDELPREDSALMQKAIGAIEGSYAPYSGFHVGAALRLKNGIVVEGSNQENVAYPSGLCAERTAIFSASAQYPQCRDYEALAIVGRNAEGVLCEASPCGACRQVLSEYEHVQGHPLRVICYLEGGRVRVFPSVVSLLPFSFDF
ncbi:MAG: cytidine deaminase [Bacteroidales bacterium]|jgi:cytidine deaminase|nr:cytidine deaminase [Bacteroidales bacterium]